MPRQYVHVARRRARRRRCASPPPMRRSSTAASSITPTLIDRVQDRNGVTIYRPDNRPCDGCNNVDLGTGQAPPDAARHARADRRSAAAPTRWFASCEGVVERGTGRVVAAVGKPLAGKTGTTNEFEGHLVRRLLARSRGRRLRRLRRAQARLGEHETGAPASRRRFSAISWRRRSRTSRRRRSAIPPGIELVRVDATTGQPARPGDKNVIYEAFKPGTVPDGRDAVVDIGSTLR